VDKRQIQGFEATAYRRLLRVINLDGTSDQYIKKYDHRNACWQLHCTATLAPVFRTNCGQRQKPVHRNTGRKTRWEEKTRQVEAKMDRWYQGLVKQNSGGLFTVGEGQATMEILGNLVHKVISDQLSIEEGNKHASKQNTPDKYTRCSTIAEKPRCRVSYSFGKKWKTGTGRQYFTDIIGLSSTTVT